MSTSEVKEHGYAIVRGVFDTHEVAEIAREMDRLKVEGLKYGATFRHQNVLHFFDDDPLLGTTLRFVHWPAYISPLLEAYRVDHRLLGLVEPLIGNDLKQIVNQVIWKPPGGTETGYSYHQDARFRRPASAYRDLGTSYVQTAIAIDPHRAENGCLRVYPGSHTLGDLGIDVGHSIVDAECSDATLAAQGLDPSNVVDVILDPGDVVLWTPFTVHGSAWNRSTIDRRFYLNGYVIAANSDRGPWAFRYVAGAPYPLKRE